MLLLLLLIIIIMTSQCVMMSSGYIACACLEQTVKEEVGGVLDVALVGRYSTSTLEVLPAEYGDKEN
jgi:hypothetical protein